MKDTEYKAKRADLALKAVSNDYLERIEAAQDLDTGLGLLNDLSKDPDWEVRRAVAANRSTTWDILETLANDPEPDVRVEVAANWDAPYEVIKRLAMDSSGWVSSTAKMNLEHQEARNS